MKHFIYSITILAALFCTHPVFAQEEFFGNQSGFSIFDSQTLNLDGNSRGASLYIANKLIIGLSSTPIGNRNYPVFSVLGCPNWGIKPKQLKLGYGISYAQVEKTHLVGFNLLLIQRFFAESKFPFSLQGDIVILAAIDKFTHNNYDLYPQAGIAYSQALFANNRVFPVFGISYARELHSRISVSSVHLGINIKIGKMEAKK